MTMEEVLLWQQLRRQARGYRFRRQFPIGPCTLDAAGRRAWTGDARANVLIQNLGGPEDLAFVIREGEEEPIRGWLPDSKRGYHPAPLFAMEGKAGRTLTLSTLLLPFTGNTPPEFGVETLAAPGGRPSGFRLSWADGTETVVVCTPGLHCQIDRCGPLETDACLAVLTLQNGTPVQAFAHEGMLLSWQGQRLIDEPVFGTYRKKL